MKGIYKITSPSNRVYIGKSVDIDRRWNDYRNYRCDSQPLLSASLWKYGVNEHRFEIQEECKSDVKNDLSILELKWYIHYVKQGVKMLNCVSPMVDDFTLNQFDAFKSFSEEIDDWLKRQRQFTLIINEVYKKDSEYVSKLLSGLVKLKIIGGYINEQRLVNI